MADAMPRKIKFAHFIGISLKNVGCYLDPCVANQGPRWLRTCTHQAPAESLDLLHITTVAWRPMSSVSSAAQRLQPMAPGHHGVGLLRGLVASRNYAHQSSISSLQSNCSSCESTSIRSIASRSIASIGTQRPRDGPSTSGRSLQHLYSDPSYGLLHQSTGSSRGLSTKASEQTIPQWLFSNIRSVPNKLRSLLPGECDMAPRLPRSSLVPDASCHVQPVHPVALPPAPCTLLAAVRPPRHTPGAAPSIASLSSPAARTRTPTHHPILRTPTATSRPHPATCPAGGADAKAQEAGAAEKGSTPQANKPMTKEQLSKIRSMTLESYAGDMNVAAEG